MNERAHEANIAFTWLDTIFLSLVQSTIALRDKLYRVLESLFQERGENAASGVSSETDYVNDLSGQT
jgi:hypothetical protein